MRYFYLILLLQFLTCTVNAQVTPHVKYTTKDGLIADRITTIAQDERGMMWFGSNFGISRYNGQAFEKIPLAEHQQQKFVTTIFPHGSSVYAGFLFNGGLAKYQNGRSTAYTVKVKVNDNPDDVVAAITTADDGSILVASFDKIYRFYNGKSNLLFDLGIYLADPGINITGLVQINKYKIVIATSKGLFIIRKNGSDYILETKMFLDMLVFAIYKDASKRIWIGTHGSKTVDIGILNDTGDFKILHSAPTVRYISYSSNTSHSFWGFDDLKGVFNLSADGTIRYYPSIVNRNSFISSIYCDRENNIWVANDPGVIKITLQNTKTYFFEEQAAAGGYMIKLQNGNILAANSKHFYLLDNKEIFKVPEFRTPANTGYIASFYEAEKNVIWCNRWEDGLWELQLKGNSIIPEKFYTTITGKKIRGGGFAKDENNNIWLAGAGTFLRLFNNKIVEAIPLEQMIKVPTQIIGIVVNKKTNTFFLGDNSTGIFQVKYEQHPGNKFSYKLVRHITAKDGLTDTYIRSMLVDSKGTLWAGTRYGGIYRIHIKASGVDIKNYNTTHGIGCTRITGIAEEHGKSLWFATCDGVHRFFFKDEHWEHYDVSNGLPSAELFHIAVDTAKRITWALTTEGVTAIEFNNKIAKAPPPIINITGIYVLGEKDTSSLYSNAAARFSSSENSVGFTFTGSSFIDEKKILYKYILEGFSQMWSEPSTNSNVTYASLPPGNYTFKVLAANAQGTWSNEPAVFKFRITQPFYKAPWFLISAAFLIALILYLAQNYHLRQKVKLQNIRLNIARDLHDDVGSALGSINLLSKTATRRLINHPDGDEIAPIFEKIGHSAEDTLEAMDDIVWSINPDKDKIEDLVIRMREFAIPLFEANNIEFNFDIAADLHKPLPMNLRRNVFLIFKESVHNIMKHADATIINIEVKTDHEKLQLQIADNGKGFKADLQTSRNGLKNIRSRADMCNAYLNITSSESGTTTRFIASIV